MALLKRKRSGLGDAMDVVTRFVNACNRHDADGVFACLHPDFDSIQPMYPSRNFRGADQVRRNWQAIFDAEPGFRLTVLRSAAVDDTIWLELHGAGRDAEVAGVFVMGVQGDRIRWARIYSALVEPVLAGAVDEPAPGLREVPPYQEEGATTAPAGDGEVVEEALIAPVLDMERSGRRRRRGRHGDEEPEIVGEEPAEPSDDEAPSVNADAAAVDSTDAETVVADDPAPVVEEALEAEPYTEVVVVTDEAEPEPPADDGGPPTEAVDVVTVTDDEPGDSDAEAEAAPAAEAEAEADEPAVSEAPDLEPDPEPPRRLFGRKRP